MLHLELTPDEQAMVPWQRVAAEVPEYGAYVRGEIARECP